MRPHSKPTPIVIAQSQTLRTQLTAQDAILFDEIAKRLTFLTIQPARQDCEYHLQRRHVDHGGNLYHDQRSVLLRIGSAERWDSTGSQPTEFRVRVGGSLSSEGL